MNNLTCVSVPAIVDKHSDSAVLTMALECVSYSAQISVESGSRFASDSLFTTPCGKRCVVKAFYSYFPNERSTWTLRLILEYSGWDSSSC